jgi:DNA ligase 1
MKYAELAELYSKLEATSKRLEKTYLISEFLKNLKYKDNNELEMFLLLIKGNIFPSWDNRHLGISDKLVIKTLSSCMGIKADKVEDEWKKLGDLGLVAAHLVNFRQQSTLFNTELTVKKVFANLRKVSEIEGLKSVDTKIKLLSELLSSADPLSARYITRSILEDLRIGVADSSLRDAIVWAFLDIDPHYNIEEKSITPDNREEYNNYVNTVQSALDKINNFVEVVIIAKEKGLEGLKQVKIKIGTPVKVMLGPKVKDFEEGFKVVGKPCQAEYKYDGFRVQIHKNDGKITLFTRRLDNVTKQFPDVVRYVEAHVSGDNFILDSEVVGFDIKTGKYLPFQSISQRIRRKYDIESIAKQFPVEVNVFDILVLDNKEIFIEPFESRRKVIESVIEEKKGELVLARSLKIDSIKLAEQLFKEALDSGNEGLMFKNLDASYKPGARVGHMVKLKPVMETLDLVIVGAEWGNGKRSGWLTSFVLACYDPASGEFLEMGKVGTGIKELKDEVGSATFSQLTELLKPYIIEEKGKLVRINPKIVLEIEYEEIQKSPTYESGFALRFPRVKTIRHDRNAEDASSLHEVEGFFFMQNKR